METDHAWRRAYLWVNVGRDRGRATVAADGQGHIHSVLSPGQIRALCPRVERVAQRARRRDPRPQVAVQLSRCAWSCIYPVGRATRVASH